MGALLPLPLLSLVVVPPVPLPVSLPTLVGLVGRTGGEGWRAAASICEIGGGGV